MVCMQALRLFVHYPFLVRAAHHGRASGAQQASDESGDWLANEALKTCLRGQTFFSVGLRGLYAFIPLVGLRVGNQSKLLCLRCLAVLTLIPTLHSAQVMWTMGGTFLLVGTFVQVVVLYHMDQV